MSLLNLGKGKKLFENTYRESPEKPAFLCSKYSPK